jgi:hypothetical protein
MSVNVVHMAPRSSRHTTIHYDVAKIVRALCWMVVSLFAIWMGAPEALIRVALSALH